MHKAGDLVWRTAVDPDGAATTAFAPGAIFCRLLSRLEQALKMQHNIEEATGHSQTSQLVSFHAYESVARASSLLAVEKNCLSRVSF